MRTPLHSLLLACLLGSVVPGALAAVADQANATPAAETTPKPTPATAPTAPEPIRLVDGRLPGRHLLRAQILLERAHFSPGEIDGGAGSNTSRAVAAFQRAHGLADSGELDDTTWAALDADADAALETYTITLADAAGPYVAVPGGMLAKSRLAKLGYGSIAEMLGERFHSSPALLRRLNPGKPFTAGTRLLVPRVQARALSPAGAILILGDDHSVNLVDGEGRVYARFPATYGSSHDPLPVGTWDIRGVWRNPTYHYNPKLFWDGNRNDPTATIQPGPNNPVGVAWISLSKPHVGIHGTPEPSRISKSQSHGCIRLTNWSVLQVASAVDAGTPVLVSEAMPATDTLLAVATPAPAPAIPASTTDAATAAAPPITSPAIAEPAVPANTAPSPRATPASTAAPTAPAPPSQPPSG